MLTIPWRASEKEAMQFLRSQGDWLNEQARKRPRSTTLLKYLQKHQFISSHSDKLNVAFSFIKGKPTFSCDESKSSVLIRF